MATQIFSDCLSYESSALKVFTDRINDLSLPQAFNLKDELMDINTSNENAEIIAKKESSLESLRSKIHKIIAENGSDFPIYNIYNQNKSNENVKSMSQPKNEKNHIKKLIHISCEKVVFNKMIPGNIIEREVYIKNLSNKILNLNIDMTCHDEELNKLDEYVFSVRKTSNFIYLDKISLRVAANSTIKFNVALKVPNLRSDRIIDGSLIATTNNENNELANIPVQASSCIPYITCSKLLFDQDNNFPVIRCAGKIGKAQEFKIFFENESNLYLDLSFEIYKKENENNANNNLICCFPLYSRANPKSTFLVNFLLSERVEESKENLFKRIFLIKVKNSNLIFHFAMVFELF